MAGILVWLPRSDGAGREEIIDVGLADLLDHGINVLARPAQGPEGGDGTLVTFDDPLRPDLVSPQEVDPNAQTWLEAPPGPAGKAGRYWVGYANSAKPGPDELQRREILDGFPVMLADDQPWVIPPADYLPKRLSRDRYTGQQIELPLDRHRQYVEQAAAILEQLLSDGFTQLLERERIVSIQGGLSFAALALSKNYRVNEDVVDLLGLVDQSAAWDICKAAVGFDSIEQGLQQKKNMAGCSPLAAPS